ncbi:MAG: alpha/beta hydrolase [Sedimentitalea sp.]
MAKLVFAGPMGMRVRSLMTLIGIDLRTQLRHAMGRRMAPDWDARFETGIRFWRHQFTAAMGCADMARGRALFDSVQTETDDVYDVRETAVEGGHWYQPKVRRSPAVVLYFHGGGYTFHAALNRRFAQMLCHRIGARLYAPDYRLSPEHAHPAQADDALAAWRLVTQATPPEQVVVIGDSAGGHMALMLLQNLRGEAQPALCVGLSPWTDIGDRGASLHENDRFDMVQGWMALQFGQWLDPKGEFGRAALSPCDHDFTGLAPIYLQAGGREILRDMVADFARIQQGRGADVSLDVWADMPHDFLAYDSLKASSSEALQRVVARIAAHVGAV